MNKKEEVKMFFTELIRYPLYNSIYAEPGETRMVESHLVERMMKRGAKVVDEKFDVDAEKAAVEASEEAKINPNPDVTITTPDLNPPVAPMDLDSKTEDDGADLLGSEGDKDDKKDEKKDNKKDKKDVKKH